MITGLGEHSVLFFVYRARQR